MQWSNRCPIFVVSYATIKLSSNHCRRWRCNNKIIVISSSYRCHCWCNNHALSSLLMQRSNYCPIFIVSYVTIKLSSYHCHRWWCNNRIFIASSSPLISSTLIPLLADTSKCRTNQYHSSPNSLQWYMQQSNNSYILCCTSSFIHRLNGER
jgi:hypothetical protein